MEQEKDVREFIRVKKEVPVKWSFTAQSGGRAISGKGYVRDVSLGGVCLELDVPEVNYRDAVFHVEPTNDEDIDCFPNEAELMWTKPMKLDDKACFCGVRFRHTSLDTAKKLQAKVEEWINDVGATANLNILDQYVSRSMKRF